MNSKTTKLLSRYCNFTSQKEKITKNWWNSLNWIQRTKERKRILLEMGGQ